MQPAATAAARAKPTLVCAETFLIHYNWTGPTGRRMSGYHEIDDDSNGRGLIVRALASGEYDGADRVIELTPDGRWNDISEDIAREILDYALGNLGMDDDDRVATSARAFIEEHLGFSALADAEREYAAASRDRPRPRG